jgi:hypothetical protein
MTHTTEHTLRLINEFLTQGGHAHGIDADTLHREAALITTAPDMLAAMRDALSASDANDGDSLMNAIAAFRPIIAKATGEETEA